MDYNKNPIRYEDIDALYLITKHDNFSKSIENLVNIINKMCQELNIDKEEYELKVFENRTLTTKNNFMEVKNERIVATI